MELRRALLLFAIVLGLAAIASSIARPPDRGGDNGTTETDAAKAPRKAGTTPSATDRSAKTPQPVTIEFRRGAKPRTLEVEQGQPATVLVDVQTPSQVDIPSLGLTAPAEPLTPAVFQVLATDTGSHRIVVQPAAADTRASRAGTLKVVPAP